MTDAKITTVRVLEPNERISEVLFGLIMVLTFTGSLSVAEAGREDVRIMLIGALGCNVAWGIIDGILYLMGCLADKGRDLMTLQSVRRTADPVQARRLIAGALPPIVASVMKDAELESLHQRLTRVAEPPEKASLGRADWLGAASVFLWVFVSTLPVALPFVFMQNAFRAMRVSNAIAIAMLLVAGVAYGRVVGRNPWLIGFLMVLLGAVLVSLTIALGG